MAPRRTARRPVRAAPRARLPSRTGAFGAMRTADGLWYWWAAWVNGADTVACLARAPDASGWVQAPTIATGMIGVFLSMAFDMPAEEWVRAPVAYLSDHGRTDAVRDDGLAANAYERLGRPAPPRVAATGAAPTAPSGVPAWVAVLGCSWPDPTEAQVTAAYRSAASRAHPDHGGNADAFARVQRAYKMAQGWLAEREERGG